MTKETLNLWLRGRENRQRKVQKLEKLNNRALSVMLTKTETKTETETKTKMATLVQSLS